MKIDWIKKISQVLNKFFTSLSIRRKKYLTVVGYAFLFFLTFLFAMILTFPYEELKNRIVYEVSAKGYGKLSIQSIDFVVPLGLKFREISFSRYKDDQKIEILKGDSLAFKLSLVSLILGRINIRFYGDLYGGEVNGSYKFGDKVKKIAIDFKDINIGDYSPLKTYIKTAASGKFSGRIKLEGDIANLRDSHGSAEINLTDFRLEGSGDGEFLKIPGLAVKSVSGTVVLEGGKIKSDGLSFKGGDIDGNVNGEVILRYPLATSLLNLTFNIKFSDQLYEDIKGLIEPLNLKKDQAGYYVFNVGGAVIFPRLR